MGIRDRTVDRTQSGPGQTAGRVGRRRRDPGVDALIALQRTVGNAGVSELLRRAKVPAPPDVFQQTPEGVTAAANALPAGANLANAKQAKVVEDAGLEGGWTDGKTTIHSGHVGHISRILIDGLSGSQKAQEGGGEGKGLASAIGGGKQGHRGRAVALVPDAYRGSKGGDTTVIVHFHGIDTGNAAARGSSAMRDTDGSPEDVKNFQLPQQLEAFVGNNPDSRVIVLMPIGVTVRKEYEDAKTKQIKKTGDTYFGLPDVDTFVDECMGKIGGAAGKDAGDITVFLSGHSGGGLEINRLLGNPKKLPHKHAFGGVFGFESIHADVGNWQKLASTRLAAELEALKDIRKKGGDEKTIAAAQLAHLQDSGFRFAVFAGVYYKGTVSAVRKTIIKWFADNKDEVAKATGGHAEVINQLWQNFQANWAADEQHMDALSHDSNFGKVLGSLPKHHRTASGKPAPAKAPPPPPPAPKPATLPDATTPPTPVHTPPVPASPAPADPKVKTKPKAPPKAKRPALNTDQLRQAAIDQAALTDAEREKIAPLVAADASLKDVKAKIADIDKQRKAKKITAADATKAKKPLLEEQAADKKAYAAALKKAPRNVKAKLDMEKALVKVLPQHAGDPRKAVEAWFGDIVPDATFLGHPIEAEGSVSPGVHKELLEKLKIAEQDLADKGKTPTIHSIGGLRPPSPATGGTLPSYHCFGLAVDIDAGSNPFVRWDTQPVVKRATLLVKGSEYDPLGTPETDVGAQWTAMKSASDAMRDYFAMRGEGAEAKIGALLAAHPEARAQGDAAAWKKTIEDDLAKLKKTDTWKHGDPGKSMLSLDKDLVLALTRAGLTWGGMYQPAKAGRDLMHFDWRSGTIQQR
jgi:hypothetical protein